MSSGCPVSRFSKIFLAPFCPPAKKAFRILFRIEAYGIENIPKEPCIVASNHRSHLDPPVLNSVFPEPLRFLAKEELFRVPILGKLLPHMGALPVKLPKPGHPIRVFIGKSKVYYDEDNLKGYRRVAEDIMESIKELARAKDSEHSRIP